MLFSEYWIRFGNWAGAVAVPRRGRKDVPLFTIRLLLEGLPVDRMYLEDSMRLSFIWRFGVMRHAPELWRKPVAP